MDGTDVETVVVTSEWTPTELHANQTGEDDSEDGDHSPPAAECPQSGNTEESEFPTEKRTDAENDLSLAHNEHRGSEGDTEDRTAEGDQLERSAQERPSLSRSVSSPLESTLAAPVTAGAFSNPAATRRSSRKPKKTWKLKLVNLQKQKRKPGVVTGQKRERKPLAPVRNSEAVAEPDGERVTSDNRSVLFNDMYLL